MYQIPDILNTIICGDALSELKKIPNESIDCVVTSPPYNKGYYGKHASNKHHYYKGR